MDTSISPSGRHAVEREPLRCSGEPRYTPNVVFEHRVEVTWGECDVAGLVYFPRMLDWCHRALEAMFAALPGGYAQFTGPRRMGIPTVRLVGDFRAPIRYGEACVVRVRVVRIGRSSVTFEHAIVGATDDRERARFEHVVAVCSLDGPVAVEVPPDVREMLAPHVTRSSP